MLTSTNCSPDAAFVALGLDSSASAGEVRARWQQLRSQHHPDKGGDKDVFTNLLHAYEAAHAWSQVPKACPECQGSGKTTYQQGFTQIKLNCPTCGGSGKA